MKSCCWRLLVALLAIGVAVSGGGAAGREETSPADSSDLIVPPEVRRASPVDTLRARLLQEEMRRDQLVPETLQERLGELGVPGEEVQRLEEREETLIPQEEVESADSLAAAAALEEEEAIPLFGHDLFVGASTAFVPPSTLPVGPDYVVGPEDELTINVWGQTQFSYAVVVTREGDVVLPEIGLLHVAGRTKADLEILLSREFGRFYTDVEVGVSLSQLRGVTVFVVGEVLRPGAQVLTSLSTVFHALYAAGGPTPTGSLRQIKLVRRSGEVRLIDFYDYLLEGTNAADARLQDGDTVFIPPVGPTATIVGAVRRPAVYELRGDEVLWDLLNMAGGTAADVYLGRVSIERIWEGREKRLLDVDPRVLEPDEGRNTPLVDGDYVTVFTVLDEQVNRVEIMGHVRRPGSYELRSGMRALDLVAAAEGVSGEAFLPRAEIIRTNLDRTTEVLSFDLGKALSGDPRENPLLEPLDQLRVFSVLEAIPLERVTIEGEVNEPGTYPLTPGMTLADLIFMAGGLKNSAYLEKAEVARFRPHDDAPGGGTLEVVDVSLTGFPSGGGDARFELQQGDGVYIRRIPRWRVPETVELIGEVVFPGLYPLLGENETLASVLARAGGVTADCHLPGVLLEREDEGRVVVDAEGLIKRRDRREDIVLHAGDRVFFPRVPETVRVEGAVYLPGSIKYVPGKRPGYYIERCGGFLDDANPGAVRIVRTDGTVDQVRSLWFDPMVTAGNLVQVPVAPADTTDWMKVFHDGAETLASLVVTIFFTYDLATRD